MGGCHSQRTCKRLPGWRGAAERGRRSHPRASRPAHTPTCGGSTAGRARSRRRVDTPPRCRAARSGLPALSLSSPAVPGSPLGSGHLDTHRARTGNRGSHSFGAKNNDLVQIFVFIIPPPIRISYEEGDLCSFVKPSRTSLSGGTQRPQALAFQGLINRKSILAIGVDVFESCWREMRQILLLHAVTLSP